MRRWCCLTLLGVVLVLATAAPVDPQGLPREPLEVLGRFVGEWQTELWIRHDGPPIRESHVKGRAVGRRTLDGRYVEFRSASIPPGQSDLQVMTYDPQAQRFRQWLFDSDGYRHEAHGRWDPATSTLRWEGQTDGAAFVIEDRWLGPDRLEWSLIRTASDGRRLQTIRGVVTRIPEPGTPSR